MMENFNFYKETDSRWYIDLPSWEGPKADLEMVLGADTLLDLVSQGESPINVTISLTEFDGAYKLTFLREDSGGGWYLVSGNLVTPYEAWLCKVTKFVFGELPEEIYIK